MRAEWTALAQHMGKWRAFVNVAMKHQFSQNAGNFLSKRETTRFPATTPLNSWFSVLFFVPLSTGLFTFSKSTTQHGVF